MNFRLVLCHSLTDEYNEPINAVTVIPETKEINDAIWAAIQCAQPLLETFGFEGKPVVITFPLRGLQAFNIDGESTSTAKLELYDIYEVFQSRDEESFVVAELPGFAKGEYPHKNRTVYLRVSLRAKTDPRVEVVVEEEDEEIGYFGSVDINKLLNESPTDIQAVKE